MFSNEINAPLVGVPGDACSSCGSALSPDQRYCLSCGTRRSGANLHFQQILSADSTAQTAVDGASAAVAGGGAAKSTNSSMPALASIACLLLALGVGVLIGKSGSGSSSATTDQGASAAPAAGVAADGAAESAAKKSVKSSSSDTPAASTAANPALKKLEKLSPEQYQKQSLKLPKTVDTGGAPPPKDNKAPAGGGSFDTIG